VQKRLLGCCSNKTNNIIIILLSNYIVYIFNYYFNLGHKKNNIELVCRNNGNRERFGFLFKEIFVELKNNKIEQEIKIE
jgi:hypothetical protein